MKLITIDVSGTPPTAEVIQAGRAHLTSQIKKYGMLQGIAGALVLISAVTLTIAGSVFGVDFSGITHIVVSAIIGSIIAMTLFISAVEETDHARQLDLLDAVDKSDCVELLKMAEDSTLIKEYCVAVSKSGRQVTKREFNVLKNSYTETIEKEACKKLYLMEV